MVLIRGGLVVDGTGKPAFKADILVRRDTISAIGNFPRQGADAVIDALGSYVMPGFIDVNTDSDHYLSLFTNPAQGSFLLQGVTTTIGGNCGASLAPLLYGSLESIRKWADVNRVNVGWHRMAEFLDTLERRGIGVNFGTLVGHATVRRALIGSHFRDLTVKELSMFQQILRAAMEEGAFGLSTGLGYVHAYGTPYAEIKNLAKIVAEMNGVYATHLRDETEGLVTAVTETARVAEDTGVRTIISHFRPRIGFEEQFDRARSLIEEMTDADIHFDGNPHDTNLVPLYLLLPEWARIGSLDAMVSGLNESHLRAKIIDAFPDFKPEDIIIIEAQKARYLEGKTIGAFAENRNLGLKEALLAFMHLSKLRAIVLFRSVHGDLAIQSLLSEHALVGSNTPSVPEYEHGWHEQFWNTFPKFIHTVTETKLMLLEAAIAKITSVPAKKFGIRNRGILREGNAADLVLMRNGRITDVFVNGVRAVTSGVLKKSSAGKVLRRI